MSKSQFKPLVAFVVIVYATSVVTRADLALGTRCILNNGSRGICINITSCASVMEQVRLKTVRTNPPTVCSQLERTVCCPLPTVSTPNSTNAPPAPTIRPLRISEQKCKEYARSIVQTVKVASLMLGEPPVEITVDKCKHKSVSLIVGGTEASLAEFPHQALLGYNNGDPGEWGCGGSLISTKFVLTAAHCLSPRGFGDVKYVKLGMNSRSQADNATFTFGVVEIIQHPSYNKRTFNEDLGLLRLNATVPLSEYILPICMPTKASGDNRAIASGFGRTGQGQAGAEKLLKVTLEKFTHAECQQAFENAITVTNDTMLCYGHHTESKDSCSGDSGGPLQVYNDKQASCTYTQIGVVSFGLKQCGTVGTPGVYVNVYHYLDWIEGIVWSGEN